MDTTAIVIIGAAILVFLLFNAQIMVAIPNVESWIGQFLGNLGIGSRNVAGSTSLGFTIHYFDGTSKDINQNATFSLLPLSIFFEGKQVESIDVDFRAKLNNAIDSWSSVSTITIEFSNPEATSTTPISLNITANGGSWSSGTIKNIASTTLRWHDLELMLNLASPQTTHWHLSVSATTKLTATINGTQSNFTSTPATGFVDLDLKAPTISLSITSVSVSTPATLNPQP